MSLSENDRWKIIRNWYEENGLAIHHKNSFDNFINNQLETILTAHVIDIPPEKNPKAYKSYKVYFSNPYVGKPSYAQDGKLRNEVDDPMYPSEARRLGLTYDSRITCTVRTVLQYHDHTGKPPQITEKEFVPISRIPIMLESEKCHLWELSEDDKKKAGECEYDQGGYFIVKGAERILVSQIKVIYNKITVYSNKDYDYRAELRSMSETTGHSSLTTCIVTPQLKVEFHFSSMMEKKFIAVGIVFNALGYLEIDDIRNLLGFDIQKYPCLEEYERVILRNTQIFDINDIGMKHYYSINPIDKDEEDERYSRSKLKLVEKIIQKYSDRIQEFREKKISEIDTRHEKEEKKIKKKYKLSEDDEVLADSLDKLSLEKNNNIDDVEILVEEYIESFIEKEYNLENIVYIEWYELDSVEKNKYILEAVQNACYQKIGSNIDNVPKSEWLTSGKQMLDAEIFPHLGTCTNKEKAYILSSMVRKLVFTHSGIRATDSRDDFSSKRVYTSGILIYDIFRIFFKRYCNYISNNVERRGEIPYAISTIEKSTSNITESILTCFKTGNWGPPKSTYMLTGVSQILSRLSYGASLSYLRRIQIPESKDNKSDARQIHPSQVGFICGQETPEGQQIGIVLNFALTTTVTTRTSVIFIRNIIERMSSIILLEDYIGPNNNYNLLLNGTVIAIIPDIEIFKEEVEIVRECEIPYEVSFGWDHINKEVNVWCDEGRMIRPLIKLDSHTKKPLVTGDMLVGENSLSWSELVEKRYIRYLDNNELDSEQVLFDLSDISKMPNATYLELHPSMIMGVMASIIPFAPFSQAPRICYSSAQSKQAMSVPVLTFGQRVDTSLHVLTYPQKPLVNTEQRKLMGFTEMPHGINLCIAILCTGIQEDAVMINKAAVQRGLYIATTYKTLTYAEETHNAYKSEKICMPDLDKRNRDWDYSLLGNDGIISSRNKTTDTRGPYVREGTVIVGKISKEYLKENKSEPIIKDISLVIGKGESGFVERVDRNNIGGYLQIRITIRQERIPEVGDKVSSVFAQKGIIGAIYDQHDMPWTMDGITPDIILNPACMPSRMTINQLLENVLGKVCCIRGKFADGTSFRPNYNYIIDDESEKLPSKTKEYSDIAEYIYDLLASSENKYVKNFEKTGKETFYSGVTGKSIGKAFMGIGYYQRLKHLVSDKLHARGPSGSVSALTRQAMEGRANNGGFKMGNMEMDWINQTGTTSISLDRMRDMSDPYTLYICKNCKDIAHKSGCNRCSRNDIKEVQSCVSFRLIRQEIEAMHIGMNIKLK